jgi:uncharacterized protein (TIGR03437 family)
VSVITKSAIRITILFLCLLGNVGSGVGQAVDRAKLLQEIVELYGRLKNTSDQALAKQLTAQLLEKENLFLAPAPADLAQFFAFLQQPYTGVVRLMPREQFDGVLYTRGGGAYYSFASYVHYYGFGSDLSFEQGRFGVGFAGADFGFLVNLGNLPLESVMMETPGVAYLASFVPPTEEAAAREQYQRGRGFSENGFFYASRMVAEVGATYALRSVGYDDADVLVVFRPFRRDTDGSLLLGWKVLKRYPTQHLGGEPTLTASAANYAHSQFAPGAIAAVFGKDLADSHYLAGSLPLPQRFGATYVTIQDSSDRRFQLTASLFAASFDQVNFLVPAETAEGYALVTVNTPSGKSYRELVNISKAAPGLFSANADGKDVAAAVALRINGDQQTYGPVARFDNTQNKFVATPIDLGSSNEQVFLLLFATGVRGRSTLDAVNVKIGGVDAPVSFAGEQGSPGLDQINVALPRALAGRGEVDVVLTVDGKTANVVRINIK